MLFQTLALCFGVGTVKSAFITSHVFNRKSSPQQHNFHDTVQASWYMSFNVHISKWETQWQQTFQHPTVNMICVAFWPSGKSDNNKPSNIWQRIWSPAWHYIQFQNELQVPCHSLGHIWWAHQFADFWPLSRSVMSVLLSNVSPYIRTNADISIHITKSTDNVRSKTAFLVRKSQHTGETNVPDNHFHAVVNGYIFVHMVLELYFKLKKTLAAIKFLVYNLSLLMTLSSSPHVSVPFLWWNSTKIFGSRNKWHLAYLGSYTSLTYKWTPLHSQWCTKLSFRLPHNLYSNRMCNSG